MSYDHETITAYPLCWPDTWKRTKWRDRARFKVSQARARDSLFNELRLMGAERVILSTNMALRLDGQPRANQGEPADPGIAVYFTWRGKPMVMACDAWDKVSDNMRAVAKSLEALRGLERWGCSDILEKAFTGFQQLPSPDMMKRRPWHEIIGLEAGKLYTREDIRKRRVELAKLYHPDSGTTPNGQMMADINAACDEAIESLKASERLMA